jgi:hypothetical protein
MDLSKWNRYLGIWLSWDSLQKGGKGVKKKLRKNWGKNWEFQDRFSRRRSSMQPDKLTTHFSLIPPDQKP